MKQTLTTSEATNILFADKNAGWTYAGARALTEYLEELEESTGEEIEFDFVAIRCDFSEYESLLQWGKDYFGGADRLKEALCFEDESEEQQEEAIREYIQERGQLIEFDGGIIASSF
jgi:hypothetical protein